MIQERAYRILLAFGCCLILVLLPMTAGAQIKQGIEKGGKEVGKGVEYGAEKTKEGAEAVGKEVKKPFTGDDSKTNADRQKPSETNPQVTPSQGTTTQEKEKRTTAEPGSKNLPGTAGELPLLGLIGTLSLAGAAASRISRRNRHGAHSR